MSAIIFGEKEFIDYLKRHYDLGEIQASAIYYDVKQFLATKEARGSLD